MERIELPRTVLIQEIECDRHNIREAVKLMGDKFDKKIAKYCKITAKHMPLTMRQNSI